MKLRDILQDDAPVHGLSVLSRIDLDTEYEELYTDLVHLNGYLDNIRYYKRVPVEAPQ